MEFLDPKAERRHHMMLILGYGLIAIAIAFAALILLYWSYGYSLNRQGEVEQNGLVFVTASPVQAKVTLDNGGDTSQTDARFTLGAGTYNMRITADGYREWKHAFKVQGTDVQRFTYPKLFPTTLTSKALTSFETAPQIVTQSPDRRWMLAKDTVTPNTFVQYDMRAPDAPVKSEVAVPVAQMTMGDGSQTWRVVEWSTDNNHLLLEHSYTDNGGALHELIMFDRSAPEKSQNLTKTLSIPAGEQLTLFNKKYDQFYGYNSETKVLRAFSVDGKVLADQIDHVRAYKSYGDDTLLYVSDLAEGSKESSGTVNVVLRQGAKRLILRQLSSSAPGYLLDLTEFDNAWYIALAATDDKGVYVYRNPFRQTLTGTELPRTWRFMPVQNPTNISFSANSQFLLVENGQTCVVYNADTIEMHRFSLRQPLDTPQEKVRWMDGHRLVYVSGDKVVIVEFDNQNEQTLQAASASYTPFYSSDYTYAYAVAPGDGAEVQLQSTPLVVKK